jgi:hypothetical protein
MIEENTAGSYANIMQKLEQPYSPPTDVDSAIKGLISEMSLKVKTTIANMTETELLTLNDSLGRYIIDKFGLLSNNDKLLQSCRLISSESHLDEHGVSAFIIKELWQELRNTHKLRVIK